MAAKQRRDAKLPVRRQRREDDALIEVLPVRESHHLAEVLLERTKERAIEHLGVMRATGKVRQHPGGAVVDAPRDAQAHRG